MAYRNGTYVAFHAEGSSDATATDMKYYRLLTAWSASKNTTFRMVNSHEKASAVRDTSKAETLRRSLSERLLSSRNMILIIGKNTWKDDDWVPFEITYAVDVCEIPIIATYPNWGAIHDAWSTRPLWPKALFDRIQNASAHVIHIPFREGPITHAISQFDHNNYPNGGGIGVYNNAAYSSWGIV